MGETEQYSEIDPLALDVDVRRALENELEAPVATLAFQAFLLAHGHPEELDGPSAGDLFARVFFAPETVAPATVHRLRDLHPTLLDLAPYQQARHLLNVLNALYYRQRQEAEALLAEAEEELVRKLYG